MSSAFKVIPVHCRLTFGADKLSAEQLATATPYLEGIVQAALRGSLGDLDLNDLLDKLHLERILPSPTITELPGVELPSKDRSIAERLAEREYKVCDENFVAGNFPITDDDGPRQLVLVNFGYLRVSCGDVGRWAAANGYESASIADTLAIGSHPEYGELQQIAPIVQFDPVLVLNDIRYVLCIDGSQARGRGLHLYYYHLRFAEWYQYLLRKVG